MEMDHGLACPPMDDESFSWLTDVDFTIDMNPDSFFDQLDGEIQRKEWNSKNKNPRNGKELRRVMQVVNPTKKDLAWIAACLKEEDDGVKKPEEIIILAKDSIGQCEKGLPRDQRSTEIKLEDTRRRLHNAYELINNAKMQKRVKVCDFQIPPPPLPPKRKPMLKPKSGVKKSHPSKLLQINTQLYGKKVHA